MALNYSKFDHLVDSDDEKPDPKASAAEARRRMFEEMQQKIEVPERVDKPAHQTDRFSYVEGDCSDAARELLKRCCCQAPSVKVGNGILSVTLVEKVEGEASMFQVRGQMRHTWDLSVKLRWTYQWMGSNFDAGAQRAEGHLAVVDFTDATTLTGEKSPPLLRKNWLDKGTLELPRQKEVEKALGGKPWPPEKGTLLASVVAALEVFTAELPGAAQDAERQRKQLRESAAQEEVKDSVRIEEALLQGSVESIGTFVNWCACGFLAMWAFMKPRESARITTRILYFLTFAIYAGGLGFYTSAANNLKDLPPMGEQVAFGPNVWGGIALCILQCIPIFVVFVFVGRTRDEAINEHQSFKKKEAREESRLANKQYYEEVGYGAAGGGYNESYGYGWDASGSQPMPAGGMQMAYPQMQGDMLAQQSPQGDTQATM